jgi:hypothetical protein
MKQFESSKNNNNTTTSTNNNNTTTPPKSNIPTTSTIPSSNQNATTLFDMERQYLEFLNKKKQIESEDEKTRQNVIHGI